MVGYELELVSETIIALRRNGNKLLVFTFHRSKPKRKLYSNKGCCFLTKKKKQAMMLNFITKVVARWCLESWNQCLSMTLSYNHKFRRQDFHICLMKTIRVGTKIQTTKSKIYMVVTYERSFALHNITSCSLKKNILWRSCHVIIFNTSIL